MLATEVESVLEASTLHGRRLSGSRVLSPAGMCRRLIFRTCGHSVAASEEIFLGYLAGREAGSALVCSFFLHSPSGEALESPNVHSFAHPTFLPRLQQCSTPFLFCAVF